MKRKKKQLEKSEGARRKSLRRPPGILSITYYIWANRLLARAPPEPRVVAFRSIHAPGNLSRRPCFLLNIYNLIIVPDTFVRVCVYARLGARMFFFNWQFERFFIHRFSATELNPARLKQIH